MTKAPWTTLPNAQVAPPRRRCPLRRVSRKREADSRVYRVRRGLMREVFPNCVVCAHEYIEGLRDRADVLPGADPHHRRGRAGDRFLDFRWIFPVCRDHHRKITDNPQWALAHGYIETRA